MKKNEYFSNIKYKLKKRFTKNISMPKRVDTIYKVKFIQINTKERWRKPAHLFHRDFRCTPEHSYMYSFVLSLVVHRHFHAYKENCHMDQCLH